MYQNRSREDGFTIVELVLAMSFLAVLLLAIAMVSMQVGSIYLKGLTLREVNQAGQQISSDIRNQLNQSVATAITADNNNQTGDRLCVDNVVYAWNYPDSLGETVGVLNVRSGVVGSESTNVRLMKFEKSDEVDYCSQLDDGTYPKLPQDATELLGSGNSNIVIHDFAITDSNVEGDVSQRIYKVSILIGTKDIGEIQDENSDACAPSANIDQDACAVNRFVFTARSGNKEER